ncbi:MULTISPECIES: protoporphyrinogen oxidase HemJ [Prochlorococcus]|uniref:Protoporphyrinogen IX oxidase n=1 Tax=Prochlorococcus marinus (strain SARG / CCMP1375 / SS120) TaxID=167539 RepID=Q7VBY7_PROMA|nr:MULTISPECIES: protoporphyrinogen oxidase HemJ [Prochlorococcus]AAP99999.1 Uncharacterized conserved membrane protein [Prochlorococcus marinus subsp. marinus str. CCMP1375]KGG13797.1 Protoporphyrinogen IX oxidase [Prochlorococcus marinus str. LG]KGG18932.1 Protoporphyrinogen IX oxidase [Prochlorococcus marinus str. SS2]KGG23530.1 Protoporphyrinogen IX oxidase [Prochlorococcus marinus str. SS35]KGG32234.1 Protoporphyrinogen IX oxidase [Prochlorococcus marinus str. SS51]
MSLPAESYLWLKTLHIIGVVVWFAGLFYLVRLFIYHVEADELESDIKFAFVNQYSLMERRLANIITTPGMILAVSMAIGLLIYNPSWLEQTWMQVKLFFVFLLLIYHIFCYRLMSSLAKGECKWSGQQLRILNELPTLFLVIVVMLVVFKNNFPTSAATWLIVFLVIFMALSIQLYARFRRINKEKQI